MSFLLYPAIDEFYNQNYDTLNEVFTAENEKQANLVVEKHLRRPELPPIECFPKGFGTSWFNTKRPLTLKDLQGKVVLLDFFTYCCINCMHILPDLKKLENEFSVEDGFVVIGVHSAKFENEKEAENVRAAIQRYHITHPVITDSNGDYWNYLGISCWPTLYMLSPQGTPIFCFVGEGNRDKIRSIIKHTLAFYKSRSQIKNHPLPIVNADVITEVKNGLSFPGKIATYDTPHKIIVAISDSSNHRIVIASDTGEIIHIVGNGKPGFKDGTFKEANFNSPQGLTFFDENTIYVADTENHAIRKIDFTTQLVYTIAGTGKQGNDLKGRKEGNSQDISSPWDICYYKTKDMTLKEEERESADDRHVLLIAMAGTHQIWAYFISSCIWWGGEVFQMGVCAAIVGTGREENRNNFYPHAASFAQPSGLALDNVNHQLFVADSESSSIRVVYLLNGRVCNVVGGNPSPENLFDFGDVDGKGTQAKFQHPLGICYSPAGKIYVADSYNHKIKEVCPKTQTARTILGNSRPGDNCTSNNTIQFNEPGGLSLVHDGKILLVADTNNNCIKMINLNGTVNPEKLEFFVAKTTVTSINTDKEIRINTNKTHIVLQLKFNVDEDVKLSEEVKQRVDIDPIDDFKINADGYASLMAIHISTPNMVPNQEKILTLRMRFITCAENTCSPIYATFNLKVIASDEALSEPPIITKNMSFLISKSGVRMQAFD